MAALLIGGLVTNVWALWRGDLPALAAPDTDGWRHFVDGGLMRDTATALSSAPLPAEAADSNAA